ncbi:MAG: hypothetical protein ABI233_05970 [Chthoniobacterales bacterium]
MDGTDDSKNEARESDPDSLARALDMELRLKRAGWQKTRERRNTWRMISALFLLLIVLGALFAFFYLIPQLRERASEAASSHLEP